MNSKYLSETAVGTQLGDPVLNWTAVVIARNPCETREALTSLDVPKVPSVYRKLGCLSEGKSGMRGDVPPRWPTASHPDPDEFHQSIMLPAPEPEIVEVAVEDLRPGRPIRVAGVNEQHARLMVDTGLDSLPPIVVHRRSMSVVDGMHRLRALEISNATSAKVRFVDGPIEAVYAWAISANLRHGLPLTLRDRKHAAREIVEAYPTLSDRAVARLSGLSPKTVGKLRQCASEENPQLSRLGQDGRVRPLDPAVGRESAASMLLEDPNMSISEAANRAGISRNTARDVRRRLRQNEDAGSAVAAAAEVKRRVARRLDTANPVVDLPTPYGRLRRDPELRGSEAGRSLLRWLGANAPPKVNPRKLLAIVPARSTAQVAALARQTAAWWLKFAECAETGTSRQSKEVG